MNLCQKAMSFDVIIDIGQVFNIIKLTNEILTVKKFIWDKQML